MLFRDPDGNLINFFSKIFDEVRESSQISLRSAKEE
jgi:hypothetical protein